MLIGVDWGTSNLRVHRIDSGGAIVESRRSAQGIPGLLTGADVLAMRDSTDFDGTLTLIGEGASGNAYAHAFRALDIPYTLLDGDVAVASGLHAIARTAGLIKLPPGQ